MVELDYDSYFNTYSDFDFATIALFFDIKTAIPTISNEPIKFISDKDNQSLLITGMDGNTKITVMDTNGRIVITKSVSVGERVSLAYLPKSVYLVKITGEKNSFIQKIIKE